MNQGNLPEADSTFARALVIRRQILPQNDSEIGRALTYLANVKSKRGREPEAIALYRQALDLAEKGGSPDDRIASGARISLATSLTEVGEFAEARHLLNRTIALLEPGEKPLLEDALDRSGSVAMLTGDWWGAVAFFRRAMRLAESRKGTLAATSVIARNNLVKALITVEEFAEARSLLDRQIEMLEESGSRPQSLGLAYGYMATYHQALGDVDAEVEWRRRALAAMEAFHPKGHVRIAQALFQLGTALGRQGRWDQQRDAIDRAEVIFEAAGGARNIYRTFCLSARAENARARGDRSEARRFLEAALADADSTTGTDTPRTIELLVPLSQLAREDQRAEEACAMLRRALAIARERLGHDHPRVGEVRTELARANCAAARPREAIREALAAHRVLLPHLRPVLRALPERQALQYVSKATDNLDLMVALLGSAPDPILVAEVWDAVISMRAVVLDEMASRNRRGAAADAPDPGDWDDYRRVSTRLANLYVRGPENGDADRYRVLLKDAHQELEEVQRRLAEGVDRLLPSDPRSGARWDDVRRALPSESALAAYVQFRDVVRATGATDSTASRYRVFAFAAGETEARTLDLGGASGIDSLIRLWRTEASLGQFRNDRDREASLMACEEAGRAVRRAIWDPLLTLVPHVDRILIVPAGQIHLVNLAALPAEGGGYLLESELRLYNLPTERETLPLVAAAPSDAGALVLGAPDFDAAPEVSRPARSVEGGHSLGLWPPREPFRGARPDCLDLRSTVFSPLPGALREAREIAEICRRDPGVTRLVGEDGGARVCLLIGQEASEQSFKLLASGRRYLHLATHGFVLGSDCHVVGAGSRAIGLLVPEAPAKMLPPRPSPAAIQNPLLLSGLALAGANLRSDVGEEEEDGILTAQEIAALDLSATRCAVLSACETGIGAVQSGEGVFGLERAFRMAGTESLVKSLWPVQDEAARRWMHVFYQAMFHDRMRPAEAARAAGLAVLRERRAGGDGPHPCFWGAFVASGDWR